MAVQHKSEIVKQLQQSATNAKKVHDAARKRAALINEGTNTTQGQRAIEVTKP